MHLESGIDAKQILWSLIFMAFGVVFSMLFYATGTNMIFLPMHMPVFLGGFILSWPYAILVALITPLVSSIFVGMPLAINLMYIIPEFIVYAITIEALYKRNKDAVFVYRIYLPLLIAMILGKLTASLFQTVLFANSVDMFTFFASIVIKGFPGIMIQLIVVPTLLYLLMKAKFIEGNLK